LASSANGPSSRTCCTSTIERAGSQSSSDGNVVPTGVQVGGGVKAGSVYRITEQGTPTLTDNPLDVAIQGKGYLQILLPSGETAYTRAGNFSTNDQGQMVTEDGYHGPAGHHHPAERHRHHDQQDRPGAGEDGRPDRSRRPSASCSWRPS
jgi:flagellar hook-basal body protein